MHNLRNHKVKGAGRGLESAGASAKFLPPYNRDLKPDQSEFEMAEVFDGRLILRTAN